MSPFTPVTSSNNKYLPCALVVVPYLSELCVLMWKSLYNELAIGNNIALALYQTKLG